MTTFRKRPLTRETTTLTLRPPPMTLTRILLRMKTVRVSPEKVMGPMPPINPKEMEKAVAAVVADLAEGDGGRRWRVWGRRVSEARTRARREMNGSGDSSHYDPLDAALDVPETNLQVALFRSNKLRILPFVAVWFMASLARYGVWFAPHWRRSRRSGCELACAHVPVLRAMALLL